MIFFLSTCLLFLIGMSIKYGIKGGFKRIIRVLTDIWNVFQPLGFNLFLLLVFWFAFTVPDQAIDMFISLKEHGVTHANGVILIGGTFIFALSLWYSSSITLEYRDILVDTELKKDIQIKKWLAYILPIAMGILVFVVMILGFKDEENYRKDWVGLFGVLGLIYLGFVLFFEVENEYKNTKLDNEDSLEVFKRKEEWPFKNRWVSFWSTLCLLIFIIITAATLGLNNVLFFKQIGAAGLILLNLSIWAILGIFWNYLRGRTAFPLSILLILIVVVFSGYNNNHTLRLIENQQTWKDPRPRLKKDFIQWFDKLQPNNQGKKPVLLIAAEGGGIRSLNWTALILKKLAQDIPDFNEYLYAISSVSGGSVGTAYYHAYHHSAPEILKDSNNIYAAEFDACLSEDFLSPVTAGLLYPELLQAILPCPIDAFDRSRLLEDAWADAFDDFQYAIGSQGSNPFDAPFLEPWNNAIVHPHLLFNTCVAETGQKGIISTVRLDSSNFFRDAVDIHTFIESDMPLKAAASASSRFPLVTSAAKIKETEKDQIYHLVDGGYFENSGLETIHQLLFSMLEALREEGKEEDIQPIVIFLKNSYGSIRTDINTEASDFKRNLLIDLLAPVKAFVKAWGRESITSDHLSTGLAANMAIPVEYLVFELNRESKKVKEESITLPLGWSLSNRAADYIQEQVDSITNIPKDYFNKATDGQIDTPTGKRRFITPPDTITSVLRKNQISFDVIKGKIKKSN